MRHCHELWVYILKSTELMNVLAFDIHKGKSVVAYITSITSVDHTPFLISLIRLSVRPPSLLCLVLHRHKKSHVLSSIFMGNQCQMFVSKFSCEMIIGTKRSTLLSLQYPPQHLLHTHRSVSYGVSP